MHLPITSIIEVIGVFLALNSTDYFKFTNIKLIN